MLDALQQLQKTKGGGQELQLLDMKTRPLRNQQLREDCSSIE
jgi:hypothetical protein